MQCWECFEKAEVIVRSDTETHPALDNCDELETCWLHWQISNWWSHSSAAELQGWPGTTGHTTVTSYISALIPRDLNCHTTPDWQLASLCLNFVFVKLGSCSYSVLSNSCVTHNKSYLVSPGEKTASLRQFLVFAFFQKVFNTKKGCFSRCAILILS